MCSPMPPNIVVLDPRVVNELLGDELPHTTKHHRAARRHHVGVKSPADVDVALHDGVEHVVLEEEEEDRAGVISEGVPEWKCTPKSA